MHERRFGVAPSRMRKAEHEMTPRFLIVELDGARTGIERAFGEFVNGLPGIEIEHAHVDPAEQRRGVRIFGIERERLQQQVLGATMILSRHAPHVWQRLHHEVPGINTLRRLATDARGFCKQDLRTDRADDTVRDLVLQLEDNLKLAIVSLRSKVIPYS